MKATQALAGWALIGALAMGTGTARATEVQVSSDSTYRLNTPVAGFAADGSSVIVWTDEQRGLTARLFDANGQPTGGAFTLVANDMLTGIPAHGNVVIRKDPALVVEPGGDFWAFWTEEKAWMSVNAFLENKIVRDRDVRGQHFDASGQALGARFQVNVLARGWQSRPQAIATPSGLVVAWEATNLDPVSVVGDGIFARRLDASGAPLSGDLRISLGAQAALPHDVALAADDTGAFVVAYDSPGIGAGREVWARRFDAQGHPSGVAALVNQTFRWNQSRPAIASGDGGFVVAWQGQIDAQHWKVFTRQLDANGAASGDQAAVSPGQAKWEVAPSLCARPSGGYLLSWIDWDGTFPIAIRALPLDAGGAVAGDRITVNDFQPGAQFRTFLVAGPNAKALATWEGFFDNHDDLGISARWLDLN